MFVGRDTLVADPYPMKSGKQFVNTLEDNIRRWGAIVGTNSEDAIENMTSPKEEQSVTTIDGIPQGPTNNLINLYDQRAQRSYADVVCNN